MMMMIVMLTVCICVCVRRTETLYMLLMAAPAKLRNWICAK